MIVTHKQAFTIKKLLYKIKHNCLIANIIAKKWKFKPSAQSGVLG